MKKILSNPKIVLLFFCVSAFLLILFDEILNISFVQFFIENVLHRDATLTGRLEVYPYIFKLFFSHKWFGYGFGNTIIMDISIWYANAQNAFWDYVIDYGLTSMIFLVLLILIVSLKHDHIRKLIHDIKLWISFSMIYIYFFIGLSEIVYNKQFIFYLGLVYSMLIMAEKKRCEVNYEK